MSITQLQDRFKEYGSYGLFAACLLLAGFIGFGLGSSSAIQSAQTSPEVKVAEIELNSLSAASYAALQQEEREALPAPGDSSADTQALQGGESTVVVASKSGSKYHYPWCAGAKQMKEENKVFFKSPTEARAAGYEPASNCKGLE